MMAAEYDYKKLHRIRKLPIGFPEAVGTWVVHTFHTTEVNANRCVVFYCTLFYKNIDRNQKLIKWCFFASVVLEIEHC